MTALALSVGSTPASDSHQTSVPKKAHASVSPIQPSERTVAISSTVQPLASTTPTKACTGPAVFASSAARAQW